MGVGGLLEAPTTEPHGGKSTALKKGKILPSPRSALGRPYLKHRGRFGAPRRHSEDSPGDPGLEHCLQERCQGPVTQKESQRDYFPAHRI